MSLYQDTVRNKTDREPTLLTVCNAGWSVLTEGQGATGPQAPPPTDLMGQGWLLSESDDSESALEETQRFASATRNPSAPFLSVFVFVLFFEWWRLRRDRSNAQMSLWGNRGHGDSFMKLETAQRERCLRRGLRLNGGGFVLFLKSESSGFQELVGRSQGRESVWKYASTISREISEESRSKGKRWVEN